MECKVLCHVLLSLLPTPAILPVCHLAVAELKADGRLNSFMASPTLLACSAFPPDPYMALLPNLLPVFAPPSQ